MTLTFKSKFLFYVFSHLVFLVLAPPSSLVFFYAIFVLCVYTTANSCFPPSLSYISTPTHSSFLTLPIVKLPSAQLCRSLGYTSSTTMTRSYTPLVESFAYCISILITLILGYVLNQLLACQEVWQVRQVPRDSGPLEPQHYRMELGGFLEREGSYRSLNRNTSLYLKREKKNRELPAIFQP